MPVARNRRVRSVRSTCGQSVGYRLTNTGGANADITLTTVNSLTITAIMRQVCTSNAVSTRKAWRCISWTKAAANWTTTGNTWGGATSGNFGTGTKPVTDANGCTAP